MEYRKLTLNTPIESVEFLVDNMGFEIIKDPFDTSRDILVKNKSGNSFKLLLRVDDASRSPVVVYSRDCLKDYFNLKLYGINFIKEPHYTVEGLTAEFTDNNGNQFRLLEKRTYEED